MFVVTPGQESLLGLELGHYRVIEKIGAGGMGEVYRAHDEHLDREVAIKVLPAGTPNDEDARKRLRNEALALSKLNHPNVATVHHFDSEGNVDYLVMEYVPGKTLRDRISEASLPEPEIIRLATQLAEGLVAAHQRKLVHRDLKPENVRLTLEGRVKILDFGLAKFIRSFTEFPSTTESHLWAAAGTLPYMAPEQLLSGVVDERSDLFSFGVILYEMATSTLPFRGDTSCAISDAILHSSPVRPLELNPNVSTELETIIIKALEKDRNLRYQTAADMFADLHRLTGGESSAHPSGATVSGAPVESAKPLRRRMPIFIGAIVLLAAVVGLWRGRPSRAPYEKVVAPIETRTPSIAVLPFTDISSEKNQEYLSDGLAEELLNYLSKIEGLKVVGRTSSFQFKGKNEDLRLIGQKLNAATILEGSVRRQGRRVRVTAQLISANDGFHLWSETYERQLGDIFGIEDDIARAVAGALKVRLLSQIRSSSQTKNTEAYNAYLQGRYFFGRRSKENVEKAVGYYEQAIKLDPGYALAWVGLAAARSHQADNGYLPIQEGYGKARGAAERALTLDANLAGAHAVMGWIKRSYDWDWAGADASYQRALELEPGNAKVVGGAAALASTLGRFDEALTLVRRAVELDTLDTSIHLNHSLHAYYAGRLEEAVAACRKTLELNPERQGAHLFLAQVYLAQAHPQEAMTEIEREPEPFLHLFGEALTYHALGRKTEAEAALAELTAKYQGDSAFQIAEVYAFRGQADLAFEWLERAYAQRDSGLSEIKGDPLLKSLERDPRYAAFLKKMRLPA